MELYIIRHAQSFNNSLTDSRQRVSDPHLTNVGKQQAVLVANYLARAPENTLDADPASAANNITGFRFTRLFTSAMLRSLQTASAISHAICLAPEVWLDIHETGGIFLDELQDQGLPGMKRSEVMEQFPTYLLPLEMNNAGWWNRPKEIEKEWAQRANRVAVEIRERYAETAERIALITHGGFAASLIQSLFQNHGTPKIAYPHLNTGISRIDFSSQDDLTLRYFNRAEHLPPELVT